METELCLSISCGGPGQQCPAGGTGLWAQQTWVWHKPSWRRSPLTPLQSCQNLHRTGETDSCEYQDPGKRSSDPVRDWPRLACECPGVSGGGMGQWWPASGLGALSVMVHAWNLLKEVSIIFFTSTIVWSLVTTEREHSPAHQQKIGWKIYWAWPYPSEHDPVAPTVSLSHQETSISLLSLSLRMKATLTVTLYQIDWINRHIKNISPNSSRIHFLSNSMKQSPG